MKTRSSALARDCSGAAAIEFAIAGPVLVLLMMGIFQFGILFLARSGMGQAVEHGARYATIYIGTENRVPTCTEIRDKVLEKGYGMNPGNITGLTVSNGVDAGSNSPYVQIDMSYAMPLNFGFYQTPPIELEYTRRAYQVQSQPAGQCPVAA